MRNRNCSPPNTVIGIETRLLVEMVPMKDLLYEILIFNHFLKKLFI